MFSTFDASPFVHEHNGRFIVAEYRDGRYYAPMPAAVAKRTGCGVAFGSLSYVRGNAYEYGRRADALRRARSIYGDLY